MKISSWAPLGLAAALSAGFCTTANANLFSDDFEMLVVAETAKDAPPDLTKPVSYCAMDGGYIEAGDPIVGDVPPTADRVRQALYEALKEQGFSANRASPSILLTYYWGVLRQDRQEAQIPYGIKSNLNARLRLVSTEDLGAEVENHILGRQKANGTNMNVSSPALLVGPTRSVIENARRPRIFIIISAFDYQGLTQGHEAKPVWRAKFSAQETSGDMDEVIPSMIAKGAPFLGKDLHEPRIVEVTLSRGFAPAAPSASSLQPAPESAINSILLQALLNRERIEFSGANPGSPN